MKTIQEISKAISYSNKEFEKQMDLKIRNGQTTLGIKQALRWVLQ